MGNDNYNCHVFQCITKFLCEVWPKDGSGVGKGKRTPHFPHMFTYFYWKNQAQVGATATLAPPLTAPLDKMFIMFAKTDFCRFWSIFRQVKLRWELCILLTHSNGIRVRQTIKNIQDGLTLKCTFEHAGHVQFDCNEIFSEVMQEIIYAEFIRNC